MSHAVALIPGFLGFDHDGGFTYFADRFAAGLRAQLEAKCRQTIPVLPVPTLPVGSLAARQTLLLGELEKLTQKLTRDEPSDSVTWHLVGHSTGGLDAVLISCTKRLEYATDRSQFSNADLAGHPDWRFKVSSIKSVTTVSAPLYGTALALAAGAELVEGKPSLRGFVQVGEMLLDTLHPIDAVRERFKFANAAVHGGDSGSMLKSLTHNELANDLRPDKGGQLVRDTTKLRGGVARFSIATMAPRVDKPLADSFFSHLWTWTSQNGDQDAPPKTPTLDAMRDSGRLVANPKARVPPDITAKDNDGVVSTNRQFIGTPLALVIGDHADVIGRYRRKDFDDTKLVDPGLLTSGAQFGDNEFFKFLGFLSEGIAGTISPER